MSYFEMFLRWFYRYKSFQVDDIFLLSEGWPVTYPVVQIGWWWIISTFVGLKASLHRWLFSECSELYSVSLLMFGEGVVVSSLSWALLITCYLPSESLCTDNWEATINSSKIHVINIRNEFSEEFYDYWCNFIITPRYRYKSSRQKKFYNLTKMDNITKNTEQADNNLRVYKELNIYTKVNLFHFIIYEVFI